MFLFQRLSDTLRAHPAALVGECGLDRARRGLATIEQQVIKRICDVSQKGVFPIGPLSALIWYSWEYAPLSDNKIGVPFSQLEPLSALTLSSWECLCVSCVGRAPCVGRSLLVSGALCVGALCVGWSPVGPSPPVFDPRHVGIRSRAPTVFSNAAENRIIRGWAYPPQPRVPTPIKDQRVNSHQMGTLDKLRVNSQYKGVCDLCVI